MTSETIWVNASGANCRVRENGLYLVKGIHGLI
jgi:hypothetical protein